MKRQLKGNSQNMANLIAQRFEAWEKPLTTNNGSTT